MCFALFFTFPVGGAIAQSFLFSFPHYQRSRGLQAAGPLQPLPAGGGQVAGVWPHERLEASPRPLPDATLRGRRGEGAASSAVRATAGLGC